MGMGRSPAFIRESLSSFVAHYDNGNWPTGRGENLCRTLRQDSAPLRQSP